MTEELLFDLLNQIYCYYPIGLPNLNHRYPGYNKLLLILENKINNLIEKKFGPWEDFVKSAESKIGFAVRDEAYHQFPSYVLRIEIMNKELNEFLIFQNIYLFISLLTNHYTIYIKQDLGFVDLSTKPKYSQILFSRIYSNGTKDEMTVLEILKSEVSAYFPLLKYAPHKLLFDYEIEGGVPHGETFATRNNFPIFNFLFGLHSLTPTIHVQE